MKYPILIVFLWAHLISHPLHVSLVNLDILPDQSSCQLSVKLFTDDFVEVLRVRYGLNSQVTPENLDLRQAPIITRYIQDNLTIKLNGAPMPANQWKLDSMSRNYEACWLHYSFTFQEDLKELSVRNTIFFDSFQDQKNLMIIGKGKTEKALQFTHKKPVSTIRF